MNRRVVWLAVALAAVAAGFAFWWVLPPEDRVTKANYARLRPTMTPDDVRALLGEPAAELAAPLGPFAPGGNPGPPADPVAADVMTLVFRHGMPTQVWTGRRHVIVIGFIAGQVAYTELRDLPRPPSVLERLRGWVGL